LFHSGLDYKSPTFLSYLTRTSVERGDRFRAEAVREEIEQLSAGAGLDERTILSFTINFEPNQTAFSAEQYGTEFKRVVEIADKFGNAVIAIRGHSDPTKTLLDLVKAGMAKGVLKRSGTSGNYTYSLNGRPLDLASTQALISLIESGSFDGVPDVNPRETMQSALNLSRTRAEEVRDSIVAYAKSKGLAIDKTQVQPVGVGVREPFIAKPANMDEAKQNMRVEFRILRVQAEASKPTDFDF
jgi:outer membrane protein OmpA-like peptidoglycan-associated protein